VWLWSWWTGEKATLSTWGRSNRRGFGAMLNQVIAAVPVLAQRRGLGDLAVRHLAWLRDFEAQRKSRPRRD
jgi:hypothetical protein